MYYSSCAMTTLRVENVYANPVSWWRHQMETFFALLTFCEGIHLTHASDAELWCFLWLLSEKNVWVNNRNADDWDGMSLIMTSLQFFVPQWPILHVYMSSTGNVATQNHTKAVLVVPCFGQCYVNRCLKISYLSPDIYGFADIWLCTQLQYHA